MVFRDVDPWTALLSIGQESAGFGLAVLLLVLTGALFVDRPWCRYACPLGAAQGLVARFSPLRLERSASACSTCKVCTRSCPMGIDALLVVTLLGGTIGDVADAWRVHLPVLLAAFELPADTPPQRRSRTSRATCSRSPRCASG